MAGLTPTPELTRAAATIAAEYRRSRVEIIGARPGNPLRAEARRYGAAIACRAPSFGAHEFNRAAGFDDDTLDGAREVIAWYAGDKVAGAFEITPGVPADALMALLHEAGYRQTGFHATFAGPLPFPDPPPAPGVEVRQVGSPEDLAAFSDAYHLGWNTTQFRVPMAPWLEAPGWRLYLGLFEGKTAGAAILYEADGDAYLADSAVDPAFRGHGVHRALLARRAADASAARARRIFSGAAPLGASHRNMLRAGLDLLNTKAVWTAPG